MARLEQDSSHLDPPTDHPLSSLCPLSPSTELCDKNWNGATIWSAIAINKYRRCTDVGAAFRRRFRCGDSISEWRNIAVISITATSTLVDDACFSDPLLAG